MTAPDRTFAWLSSLSAVVGTATTTQDFTILDATGMPDLPFELVVTRRNRRPSANDVLVSESILVTAGSISAGKYHVTACTRNYRGTGAVAIDVNDDCWQSTGFWMDYIESFLGTKAMVGSTFYAGTRAAAETAAAAVSAGGGGEVRFKSGTSITFDSTALTLYNNVKYIVEPGCTINAPTGAVAGSMFTHISTYTSNGTLNFGADRGARVITLDAGQAASLAIVAGSFIKIYKAGTFRYQICKVKAVFTDTLELYDALDYNFLTADTVARLTNPLTNCSVIVDGLLDATLNTGIYHAILVIGHVNCYYKTTSKNFELSAVQLLSDGYGNTSEKSRDEGSADNGYATYGYYQENGLTVNNNHTNSNGFGFLFELSSFKASQLKASGGTLGRNIKIDNCANSVLSDSVAEGNVGAYSGIMVSGSGTYNIKVIACEANGGLGYGMQTSGELLDSVQFINCTFQNNIVADFLSANGDTHIDCFNPKSAGPMIFNADSGRVRDIYCEGSVTGASSVSMTPTVYIYGNATYNLFGTATARRTDRVISVTIAVPGVVTWANHGLPNDAQVSFSTTGALPTGIIAGTTYYVVNTATNTFQLSLTQGGASINTTGSQSGVHSIRAAAEGAGYRFEAVSLSNNTPAYNREADTQVLSAIEGDLGYSLVPVITGGVVAIFGGGIADHTIKFSASLNIDAIG